MFNRLGAFVSRHWVWVLVAWAAVAGGIHLVAPRWQDVTHDGDFAYLPAEMTSVRAGKLFEAAFPEVRSKSRVVLVLARAEGRLQAADFEVAERLLKKFTPRGGELSPILDVRSHESPVIGKKLISRPNSHGQALLIALLLRNEFMAVDNMKLMSGIYRHLDALGGEEGFPQGLQLGVTGSAAVGSDMLFSAEESIRNTELTTIVLVLVILLLVYRAPGLAIVPLVTIAVSVWLAMDLVALLTQLGGWIEGFDFKVFKTSKIFIVVILFGAGTDYCLFLISRYREQLQSGGDPRRAIASALGHVGDALAASALTTVFGLGTMFFADFGKFSNSGPAIALCLIVALAACVTLAPALLRAGGRAVFWPFPPGRANGPGRAAPGLLGRGWQRLGRAVTARPGLILLGCLLVMAPLAYEGFSVPVTYDLLNELQEDRPSVRGTRLLRDHFFTAEIDPVTVLAYDPRRRFLTPQGERNIALLTDFLFNLEYVDSAGERVRPIASVRSLSEPLGNPPGSFNPLLGSVRDKLMVLRHRKTKALYASQSGEHAGRVARFDLVFRHDPFSKESVRLLDHVDRKLAALSDGSLAEWPAGISGERRRQLLAGWRDADFDFLGTTAGIRDLETVTTSDRTRIQILVVIAVLFILILILRRPRICLYLILSVLLGYFVTIGITEMVFSGLYGETFQGLDWKIPIFLFVILIAVGEDYNIYLTTRVFEEQRRRGPLEGLRVGLVRTGGIITSCGVIMAGTFASMTTGTLRTMHVLGFALALGVLLDTFVIRTVLVPAFLALLARREAQAPATAEENEPAGAELVCSRSGTCEDC